MIQRIVLFSILLMTPSPVLGDPKEDYNRYCAQCHGKNRLGLMGPALIPETLKRMRGPKIETVIASGRAATQMPPFDKVLSKKEIKSLANYLRQPVKTIPAWGTTEISSSLLTNDDYTPSKTPVFKADPLNLFLVVEKGDHHISVLDGDRFTVLDRFKTPFSVHGGPKFTPDGRYVFIMSRDGWVQKYDLWSLKEVGRIRAGLNSRNIAISKDGKHLAVANYLPQSLTILSTDTLAVEKILDVRTKNGTRSRVSAVYQAPKRDSFILALKDAPEVWEIMTNPNAGPQYEGFVHSHEKGMTEAIASSSGLFALRRIKVSEPIDDFFFTPDYRHLIGAARDGKRGIVLNLTVGREIAELPLPGLPHLGSGISWVKGGRQIMATPHLKEPRLSILDVEHWRVIKTIQTFGPGFFLRSHENSPYVWADVFFGPHRDIMHVIDKQSLEIVKTLRPEAGATVAHVEFDRFGKHALVSVWEDEGALIIYDTKTLEEVKRLPMRKPSGKYNVWNKITFSSGTSH